MSNRNRERGDYFERRCREALEADGWVVIRSAGSFGPADLVALKPAYTPRLVSCKTGGKIPRRQVLELADAAEAAGAFGVVAWREAAGWVGMQVVNRHGIVKLPSLKMPPSKSTIRRRAIHGHTVEAE